MTRRSLLVCAAVAATSLTSARYSFAQQFGPIVGGVVTSPLPPLSPENGAEVAEGVLLHGGVGVEAGYDSNVFYSDTNPKGSALLRVTPFLDLTNTARNGEVPSGLFYDLHAALTYREYLTSNPDISRLRAFMPSASAAVEHNSKGTLALGFTEIYSRLQDPPYASLAGQQQEMITRDDNVAAAQLRWSPGGGRLQGVLRYMNTIDWFETADLKPADSIANEVMLDLSWRWLPKTALYLQIRQGYISYWNDQPGAAAQTSTIAPAGDGKSSSFPLRAMLGIRGLVTEKITISLAVGYENGFYSHGESTSGFLGATLLQGEIGITPIYSTKIRLGARHDFENSVIGNFYYDDGAYASVAYQTLSKVVGQLWGTYDHRRFYGVLGAVDPRIDNMVQAGAMVDYYLKSWAYTGLSYTLILNRSNNPPAEDLPGLNYTKHQVFARLGFTY